MAFTGIAANTNVQNTTEEPRFKLDAKALHEAERIADTLKNLEQTPAVLAAKKVCEATEKAVYCAFLCHLPGYDDFTVNGWDNFIVLTKDGFRCASVSGYSTRPISVDGHNAGELLMSLYYGTLNGVDCEKVRTDILQTLYVLKTNPTKFASDMLEIEPPIPRGKKPGRVARMLSALTALVN